MTYDCMQVPSFKNFRGTIEVIDNERYATSGEIAILDDQTIEITELPIRTWTQSYKESVLEPMLQGTDKTPAFITLVFVIVFNYMYKINVLNDAFLYYNHLNSYWTG